VECKLAVKLLCRLELTVERVFKRQLDKYMLSASWEDPIVKNWS